MPPKRSSVVYNSPRTQRIAGPRRLNLDYLRAKPRQKSRRKRSRNQLPQLQHSNSRQRPVVFIFLVAHRRVRIVSESAHSSHLANAALSIFLFLIKGQVSSTAHTKTESSLPRA